MYILIHTHTHTYIHTYIHACMHTYIHKYIHVYMYTCTGVHRKFSKYSIHMVSVYIYIDTCVYNDYIIIRKLRKTVNKDGHKIKDSYEKCGEDPPV